MKSFNRNRVEDTLEEILYNNGYISYSLDKIVRLFMGSVCNYSNSPDNKWLKSDVTITAIKKSAEEFLNLKIRTELYNKLDIERNEARDLDFESNCVIDTKQTNNSSIKVNYTIDEDTQCRLFQCFRCGNISRINLIKDAFKDEAEWKSKPLIAKCNCCSKTVLLDNSPSNSI